MMKLLKRSHAHVTAKASLSIWAYFTSVTVIDLEMNDAGFHVFGSSSCNRIAPRPYDDASATIFVALLGSYNVSTGAEVNAILTLIQTIYSLFSKPHAEKLRIG
jgi:hypothetical protein